MYQGPGIYQHYKGDMYEVLGLALQEDTVRKSHDPVPVTPIVERVFVIYKPLSEGSLLEERAEVGFWARDVGNFNEDVRVRSQLGVNDDLFIPRFQKRSP
jgi:hypothetical protein